MISQRTQVVTYKRHCPIFSEWAPTPLALLVLGQAYIQVAIMIREAFATDSATTRAGLLEGNVQVPGSDELGEEFKLPKMASLVIVIAYNTMLQVRGCTC